jgi:diaminopimelate decarboxylase
VLLGSVFSIKENYGITYVGTDLGFNVLKRPVMYDAHHDVEVYRRDNVPSLKSHPVTIVGNICESGDIMAKDRLLPQILIDDVLGVLDAGAYGYCMASNYNNRLRPAEVMIGLDGNPTLIRRRDTYEDLVKNFL